MSLDRINRIEEAMKLHKEMYPDMPDFSTWNDEDLEKYTDALLVKQHRQEGIRSLDMALDKLEWEFMQALITKKECELMKEGEIEYWKKLKEAHND